MHLFRNVFVQLRVGVADRLQNRVGLPLCVGILWAGQVHFEAEVLNLRQAAVVNSRAFQHVQIVGDALRFVSCGDRVGRVGVFKRPINKIAQFDASFYMGCNINIRKGSFGGSL